MWITLFRRWAAVWIFFVASSSVLAQRVGLEDTLAMVGPLPITARDLIERIQLMPWPEKENPSTHDTAKSKGLYSLIAEKLFALQGRRHNLADDSDARISIATLEQALVRDELYKREIVSKVDVSEGEIAEGLRRFTSQLEVLLLSVRSKAEGDSLARRLAESPDPPTTIRLLQDFVVGVDTIIVKLGSGELALENAAYSIGRDRISRPFFSRSSGWTVLYLLERSPNPTASRMSLRARRHHVREIIRARKEQQEAHRFSLSVLSGKRARTDSSLFVFLAGMLHEALQHTVEERSVMVSEWIDYLKQRSKAHLEKPFVELNGSSLSVAEVLEALRYEDRPLRPTGLEAVQHQFNEIVKRAVELYFLSQVGYERGLQQSSMVQRDVGMWTDAWLAQRFIQRLADTVEMSEEEVREFMIQNADYYGKAYEVNVREILVPDLESAKRVLDEIESGEEFAQLARKWTTRKEWRERGGESGYFLVSEHPAIGIAALQRDIGEIVGPINLPEGYSIFKILGKRKRALDVPAVEEVMAHAREELFAIKRQRILDRVLAELSQEYPVQIWEGRLKKVEIIRSNMVTRRLIGFGGVMMAAPMLQPQWEWVRAVRERVKVIP
jgi:hypothetical protein